MTCWLVVRDANFFKRTEKPSAKTKYRRIDLGRVPCPCVAAAGLRSTYGDYWLEADGVATWLESNNPHGWLTGERLSVDKPAPAVMAGGMGGESLGHILINTDGAAEAVALPVQAKPPYRVPLMSEIAAIPWNGLKVISTFSGCGGSSLGYKLAGFKVLWANEFIPAAQDVYRLNHPDTILDPRDIRLIHADEILEATGLKVGELDLLDGSPPCAAFSTAGRREKTWNQVRKYSDTKQRVDDLFFEFIRILKGIQPKVFIAENVSGLVKGTAKGMFLEILEQFQAAGYTVKAKLLDAQWLGVPQTRQRIIYCGVRSDIVAATGLLPVYPKPLNYRYSVRDALPWIDGFGKDADHQRAFDAELSPDKAAPTVLLSANGGSYYGHEVQSRVIHDTGGSFRSYGDITNMPSPAIKTSDMAQFTVESQPVPMGTEPAEGGPEFEGLAIGAEWDGLREGETSEKFFNLKRNHRDEPSGAVTAIGGSHGTAAVTHPTEKRKFTIAELRRICAFPDDFQLTGTFAQQWERLGRAVPPLMMQAIATAVRDGILIPLREAEQVQAAKAAQPKRARKPAARRPSRAKKAA